MKRIVVSLFLVIALVACSKKPATIPNPYEPQPGDWWLDRSEVSIEWDELTFTQDIDPQQAKLHLEGNLSDPCHELRAVIYEADENNVINVEFYAISDPSQGCVQVLEPYAVDLMLGTYPGWQIYTVHLNGEYAGEFEFTPP